MRGCLTGRGEMMETALEGRTHCVPLTRIIYLLRTPVPCEPARRPGSGVFACGELRPSPGAGGDQQANSCAGGVGLAQSTLPVGQRCWHWLKLGDLFKTSSSAEPQSGSKAAFLSVPGGPSCEVCLRGRGILVGERRDGGGRLESGCGVMSSLIRNFFFFF